MLNQNNDRVFPVNKTVINKKDKLEKYSFMPDHMNAKCDDRSNKMKSQIIQARTATLDQS